MAEGLARFGMFLLVGGFFMWFFGGLTHIYPAALVIALGGVFFIVAISAAIGTPR